jgi:hypothetical protein
MATTHWFCMVNFKKKDYSSEIVGSKNGQQTYLKFPSPSSGQNGLKVWPCALEK